MTQHDDQVRLRHMLDHAVEAVEMLRTRNRQDLDRDRQLSLAMTRLLEIVGEAAAHVSQDAQNSAPAVPWPSIVGLRNRLVHGYDDVNFDILWEIVKADLPPLIAQLRTALGDSA